MFKEIALKLYDNGYQCVPARGKEIHLPNWPTMGEFEQPRSLVERMIKSEPLTIKTSVAYVFGAHNPCCAIDVDILDEKQSREVYRHARKILGDSPLLRIGQHPKFALLYRKRGTVKNRKFNHLEVFGSRGAALNLFGIHPKTKANYIWPLKTPLDVKPCELPEIGEAELDLFLDKVGSFLSFSSSTIQTSLTKNFSEQRRGRNGAEFGKVIMSQLAQMEPGNRHEILISVIGSLVNRGMGDDEIKAVLDRPYVARFRGDKTNRDKKIMQAVRSARRCRSMPGEKKECPTLKT